MTSPNRFYWYAPSIRDATLAIHSFLFPKHLPFSVTAKRPPLWATFGSVRKHHYPTLQKVTSTEVSQRKPTR